MADVTARHLNYIKSNLIREIVSSLVDESLESSDVEHSASLDGFMSALYKIRLVTKTKSGTQERQLIAKFMKGDASFRETTKSYAQFANEVVVYSKILPAYKELLETANVTTISVDSWVPRSFIAKFGYIEGLSISPSARESVLVLENLKPLNYVSGPRLYLNSDQLLSMCKPLAEYHALSYALRFVNETKFKELINEIKPLHFINDNDPQDKQNNLYRVLYRHAFDRFFDFFDRKIDSNTFEKKNEAEVELIESLRRLRQKYNPEPTRLLEHLRTNIEENDEDRLFGTILHGDYNRNNVLFRHKKGNQGDEGDSISQSSKEVEDVKMIDFQELRYGTPAIDLSFFMYMNTPDSFRSEIWDNVLKTYHTHMQGSLETILRSNMANHNGGTVEKYVQQFSFENFSAHFSRYAFYGVLICMHFLPWLLASEEECTRLSTLFETDIHGEEFRKLSIEAGGDDVNVCIHKIIKHSCEMGYMKHI